MGSEDPSAPPGSTELGSGRAMVIAAAGAVAIFLVIQLAALALVEPFVDAGYQQVEDPTDPANSVLYVGVLLVATAGILVAIRLGVEWVLRGVILLTSGVLAWYVLSVVIPYAVPSPLGAWLAVGGAAAVTVALYVHPEWYVIDAAGILIGAGGAGLFGISFGPLPAVVLLVVLAAYDVVAVYRTEHMLDLAESVTALQLPLVLVIPLSLTYSFLDTEGIGAASAGPRDAFFIGLGDAVIPTVLVASAGVFTTAPDLGVPGLALTLPALAAMVGTLLGLVTLLGMVAKGRAHAGLPLLNGGAIAGYLIGASLAGVPLVDALGLAPYL